MNCNLKSRQKLILFLSLLVAIGGTIAHAAFGQLGTASSCQAIGSDDAYISYRYAENFYRGNGLVFNAGERVEGYSNFLYTVILSPTLALGKDWVYPASVLINCVFLAFALLTFWRYCRDELGERLASIGVVLLSLNPFVWVNGATGLETNLILWITIGAWISVEGVVKKKQGGFFYLSAFCVLSLFSRVDGFILPFICLVYLLIKGDRRSAINLTLILALVMFAYTAFRVIYYNDVIANTFYNKISRDLFDRLYKGLAFLKSHSLNTGVWLAIPLAALILLDKRISRRFIDRLNFAIIFFAAWSSYLIYIGGDVYYERFVVALIPMAIYTVLYATSRLNRFALYTAILLLLMTPFLFVLKDGRFEYTIGKYDSWIETGRFLGKIIPVRLLPLMLVVKSLFFLASSLLTCLD
ncbi:MAG: glycosyltransferase family 39 protein [Deltaproteobacteria bacterium]|nr:glycosyltransferase family 39 protein [Deltaproteobacteria bacterium]